MKRRRKMIPGGKRTVSAVVDKVREWSPVVRWSILLGICLAAFILTASLSPIAQLQSYHDFADRRSIAGIPRALDVFSNLAFMIPGMFGLVYLFAPKAKFDPGVKFAYSALFAGLILTSLGSAYYHLAPDNQRLIFDRLPMTIAMAGCIAIILIDRFSKAFWTLPVMMATGLGTVLYWAASEQRGHGDLRWYGLYQGLTMISGAGLLLLFPSRAGVALPATRALVIALAGNVAAKIFEFLDWPIYWLGGIVSGHTLKHLSAGLSFLPLMLLVRRTASAKGRSADAIRMKSRGTLSS